MKQAISNSYFLSSNKIAAEKYNIAATLAWAAKSNLPFHAALESLLPLFRFKISRIFGLRPFFTTALLHSIDELKEGKSLSHVLDKHFRYWLPDFYIKSIQLAEERNCLQETLQQLAETSKNYTRRKREIFRAFLYPAILFSASFTVLQSLSFMAAKFSRVFMDLIPDPNQELFFQIMNKVNIIQTPLSFLLAIHIPLLFYILVFTDSLDRILARVPFVRAPFLKWNKREAIQSLAIFLKFQKSISESLEMVIESQPESKVKVQFLRLKELTDQGTPLPEAWKQVFPKDKMEYFYINNGSKNDNLVKKIQELDRITSQKYHIELKKFLATSETTSILLIGMMIGIITISFYNALVHLLNQALNL